MLFSAFCVFFAACTAHRKSLWRTTAMIVLTVVLVVLAVPLLPSACIELEDLEALQPIILLASLRKPTPESSSSTPLLLLGNGVWRLTFDFSYYRLAVDESYLGHNAWQILAAGRRLEGGGWQDSPVRSSRAPGLPSQRARQKLLNRIKSQVPASYLLCHHRLVAVAILIPIPIAATDTSQRVLRQSLCDCS